MHVYLYAVAMHCNVFRNIIEFVYTHALCHGAQTDWKI